MRLLSREGQVDLAQQVGELMKSHSSIYSQMVLLSLASHRID